MKKVTFAVACGLALIMTPAAHAGVEVVPEPSSLMMLVPGLFALGGLAVALRRKR